MKKILLQLVFIVTAGTVQINAQEILQGIGYQAIARNAFNQPLVNIPIMLKISILGDNDGKQIYFLEQHQATTDEKGLFTIVVGQGKSEKGILEDVPWSNGELWLKVEITRTDQIPFNVVSNNRFMAVPYAMYAASASTLAPQSDESTEKNQSIYWTTGGNSGTIPPTHFVGSRDNKDLYIKTNDTPRIILTKEGQMRILSGVSGDEEAINSYPLIVQNSNQGIYIKVSGSRSGENNFITFADDINNTWWGAVEGQTVTELENTWEYKLQISKFAMELVVLAKKITSEFAKANGEAASVLDAGAAAGGYVKLGTWIGKLASLLAESITYNIQKRKEIGVSYSTGAADYAEWLERANDEPKLRFGQVVGVIGGKISLNTKDADHYRVISFNPGVVGNMPKPELKAKFEKVAFMGQVKVQVAGPVSLGDYIIPSGNNDGYGMAVAPSKMKIGDYKRIIGVAWEAAKDVPINYVNVAVGVGSYDLSQQVELLEKKINNIRDFLKGQSTLQVAEAGFGEHVAQSNQTELKKLIMDEDFDEMLDQNAGIYKEIFAKIITNLQEKGIDINAVPQLAEFLADPLPMMKKIRRDPEFISQWALVDQKLFNRK